MEGDHSLNEVELADRDRELRDFLNSAPTVEAGNLSSGPTVVALKTAFAKLDLEDGRITLRELKSLLIREGLSEDLAIQHAEGYFRVMKQNFDRALPFRGFIQEYVRLLTFRLIKYLHFQGDINNDGVISKSEMFEALAILMGDEQAESQIDDIFQSIDVDGSGECSMEEICMWYFTRAGKLRAIQRKSRAALRKEFDEAMIRAQLFIHPAPPSPEKVEEERSQTSNRSKAPSRSDTKSAASDKGKSRGPSRRWIGHVPLVDTWNIHRKNCFD